MGRGNHPRCQVYGKLSHLAISCYYRLDCNFQPLNNQHHQMQAMTTTPQTITDPSWYVNYGVTHHLNSNINNLNAKNPCNGEDKITIPKGTNLVIKHTSCNIPNF